MVATDRTTEQRIHIASQPATVDLRRGSAIGVRPRPDFSDCHLPHCLIIVIETIDLASDFRSASVAQLYPSRPLRQRLRRRRRPSAFISCTTCDDPRLVKGGGRGDHDHDHDHDHDAHDAHDAATSGATSLIPSADVEPRARNVSYYNIGGLSLR
ncbi:unnamed protein product [Danaus chrysippus]|uniref:(African queen) hypothetical protein n=1 Tax=Danaus chrysippus TaxID=151541 RepID=A0A8J2R4H6_9NEOP|nr:unnamed protein product [Danaus chrysippus]